MHKHRIRNVHVSSFISLMEKELRAGNWNEVIRMGPRLYFESLQFGNHTWRVHFAMGFAFRKLKRFQDSIYHLQISLRHSPSDDKNAKIMINRNLMVSFQKLHFEDDALIHAMTLLELANDLESFSETRYKTFNNALRLADETIFQKTISLTD